MNLTTLRKSAKATLQRQAGQSFAIAAQHDPETPAAHLILGQVQIPPKLEPIFAGPARYRCAYGGRGSAKSRSFALMAALRGYQQPLRILCARELQNSIKDSVHSEVVSAICSYPWLMDAYVWGESYIRGKNGTELIFKGLRHNAREIKSTADIDICWVEEAEVVSKQSWDILVPTIRKPGSEIWVTWNPESEDSETRRRFVLQEPQGIKLAQVNWSDNPWFPDVLEQERQDCLRLNPDDYGHIWEGETITRSAAQILNGKWTVTTFEPQANWDGPYHGADWGFGTDPTAAIKAWVCDRTLYIERESYAHHLELDDTGARWVQDIPGIEKHVVRADNARPESISHVRRGREASGNDKGAIAIPRLVAVKKWPGSVEDGIAHLRSYEQLVIHPRCEHMITEARKYSYKIDRNSGDVLPVVVDKFNHCVDALRYALGPLIEGAIKFTPNSTATIKPTKSRKTDRFGR